MIPTIWRCAKTTIHISSFQDPWTTQVSWGPSTLNKGKLLKMPKTCFHLGVSKPQTQHHMLGLGIKHSNVRSTSFSDGGHCTLPSPQYLSPACYKKQSMVSAHDKNHGKPIGSVQQFFYVRKHLIKSERFGVEEV